VEALPTGRGEYQDLMYTHILWGDPLGPLAFGTNHFPGFSGKSLFLLPFL
jgi:hypothetical protein